MSNEIISQYVTSGEAFIKVARAASNEAMSKLPDPKEWSGAFIVHHMADFEVHFSHRIFRLLTEENPEIAGYSEEPYPNNLNYGARDWKTSLALIESARAVVAEILSLLDPAVLSRPGVHSERGAITLSDIVTSAAKHIDAHRLQLETALAS
jgi:hypothetical protein